MCFRVKKAVPDIAMLKPSRQVGPSGPQPATYDHLQTLANILDQWSPKIWWVHQGIGEDNIRHAGTSSKKLEESKSDKFYAGTIARSRGTCLWARTARLVSCRAYNRKYRLGMITGRFVSCCIGGVQD